MGAASSQTSDLELVKRVRRVCQDELHLPVSPNDTVQNAGSEDISYMMNRGQATFMHTLTHRSAPGHNDRFDFDETYLKEAVKIFALPPMTF